MNWTVLGQPTSIDSVTISRDSQRKCIKYYKRSLRQDSIITDLNTFIDSVADVSVDALDGQLSECRTDLETMTVKRDNWKKVGIATGIIAVLEGAYIWIRETVLK